MITLQELSQYLDSLFSLSGLADYCPNGLQVEGKKEIQKVAFAVSASVAALEVAVKENADALIVHHGIFWNKDSYLIRGSKQKKLSLLLNDQLSLFAYHLPLDAHREVGNNWKAAKDLGWQNLQPFSEVGVKGEFSSMTIEDFQTSLENYYHHSATKALGGKRSVKTAALISGGAYRYLELAAEAGIDCFITGNFDEPAWDIAHEQKINFFALGHYATETVGISALKDKIEKELSVTTLFLDLPNPF